MNILKKSKSKLIKYNQEHIIKLMKKLDEKEIKDISEQVNKLNFKQVNKLYKELSKKELEDSKNIEEIVALNKDKLSEKELKHYTELGDNILKNNQYALVTMSGG